MKRSGSIVLGVAVAAALLAIGYWSGRRVEGTHAAVVAASPSASAGGATEKKSARKLLYYRNPMGLPDTSPTPKKDPMGMDYIPVYEGEDEPAAAGDAGIRISTEKIQKLGVRTERAALRSLQRSLRLSARVEVDERRVTMVAPRFEGYIEKLHVNVTGQVVQAGQPLLDFYSPELVAAQREYVLATQAGQALQSDATGSIDRVGQVAQAALVRLRNLGLTDQDLQPLTHGGEVRRTLTVRAPSNGVITEKKALLGMRFMPGEGLFQISDLSLVWVIADVPEQDLTQVRVGAPATVTLQAFPGQRFTGRVSYVYPTLKPETRTVPVRIELANPGLRLRPAMFAQVELQSGPAAQVLTVPDSALLDTGTRRLVLVQHDGGRFEPREVRTGARDAERIEILEGLREGETVVVAANFLIDAESNLRAALTGLSPAQPASSAAVSGKVGAQAHGRVDALDVPNLSLTLSHDAIPALKWPAMTMEFKVANASLLTGLKKDSEVQFEFVERGQGEWVITAVNAVGAK